jgi:hypothetical protein
MPKYEFTQEQFDEISFLLRRRGREGAEQAQATRARIRKHGLVIPDHHSAFTDADFRRLLRDGEIVIRPIQN